MNTPAHVAVNLLCLGQRDRTRVLVPTILGALVPDLPMFWFYFFEKVVRGTPERLIWSQAYYQAGWQNFIDLFNSLPIAIAGLLVTLRFQSKVGVLFFASILLHIMGDLPLHHDDGHRHFFPFSQWRFESPISYWDPNHYGDIVLMLEILVVLISCIILFRTYRSRFGKLSIGFLGLGYFSYFVYALVVWRF